VVLRLAFAVFAVGIDEQHAAVPTPALVAPALFSTRMQAGMPVP
jgi:hypothetical protein